MPLRAIARKLNSESEENVLFLTGFLLSSSTFGTLRIYSLAMLLFPTAKSVGSYNSFIIKSDSSVVDSAVMFCQTIWLSGDLTLIADLVDRRRGGQH